MQALGTHIIIDCYECDAKKLDDIKYLETLLVEAALRAGCEIREVIFHKFAPQGVSGVIIISESHISIHTYPEYRVAMIDIFTCGNKADPNKALQLIIDGLICNNYNIAYHKRGKLIKYKGVI